MANINKVMLLGNLTRDFEVRHTGKGVAVCEFSVALNRHRTSENGEKIEEVTFVDVTLWGKLAELAGRYLSKGRSVFIEGRLQLDQWTDKATGDNRSKLRVVGESVQFIGGAGGGGARKPPAAESDHGPPRGAAYDKAAAQNPVGTTSTGQPIYEDLSEDDTPF